MATPLIKLTSVGEYAILPTTNRIKKGGSMSQLVNRMVRAAMLDVNLYDEVEADTTATRQALFVVLIYSICAGIGSGLADLSSISVAHFFWNLFVGLLIALGFWLIWSLITYFIGTTLFRGPETSATYGELLRTIGFSATPGILMIFAFVPFIGWLISLAAWVWMLIAMVIAVRQALDFTTWRAIGTCAVGGVAYLVFALLLGLIAGLGAMVFLW
jgi:hypothetical protein